MSNQIKASTHTLGEIVVKFEMPKQFIDDISKIDAKALELHKTNPAEAVKFLNDYSNKQGSMVMDRCIELGDYLWTKYDEKF